MLLSYLKAGNLFGWAGTYGSNWRKNSIFEWEKNRKRWKDDSRSGSPSWKLKCIVAEVGYRGYIPPSFRKALQHFGFTSRELKKLVDECSLVSRFHSISDGSNRYCCIQIHSCGMIFLLQFYFYFYYYYFFIYFFM